jgi:hypothetical protein
MGPGDRISPSDDGEDAQVKRYDGEEIKTKGGHLADLQHRSVIVTGALMELVG